jgi:hypothetical protein
MKAPLGLFTAFCLFTFISCNKGLNSGTGEWSLNGLSISKNFSVVRCEEATSTYFILSGLDSESPKNKLDVYFSEKPTVSGRYQVVQFNNDIILNSNQVGIRSFLPNKGSYNSTGLADNISKAPAPPIDVLVQAGKLRIEIPNMATCIISNAGLDTVQLVGSIREY